MTPRFTIVLQSHRPHLLPVAVANVMQQTALDDVQLLVQHARENWAEKFNQVAAAAVGEYLIPLCDDDLLHPEYVAECRKVLDVATPALDCLYTDRTIFQDFPRVWWKPSTWRKCKPWEGIQVQQFGPAYPIENAGPKGYYSTPMPPEFFIMGASLPMTCVIRTSVWRELGGYDNIPHADTELYYRMAEAEKVFGYLPKKLFWYRQHPTQQCRVVDTMRPAMEAFHKKHFRRFGIVFDAAIDVAPDPAMGGGPRVVVASVPEEMRDDFERMTPTQRQARVVELLGELAANAELSQTAAA